MLCHLYGANIFCSVSSTLVAVGVPRKEPSFFFNLSLSTVRNWSSATCPFTLFRVQSILVGYFLITLVSGAMMTVARLSLISFGDIITHGLVLRISLPCAGSSDTRYTSNCFMPTPTQFYQIRFPDLQKHHFRAFLRRPLPL